MQRHADRNTSHPSGAKHKSVSLLRPAWSESQRTVGYYWESQRTILSFSNTAHRRIVRTTVQLAQGDILNLLSCAPPNSSPKLNPIDYKIPGVL